MIGSLQRQLDVATGRLADSKPKPNGIDRKTVTAKSRVKATSGATTARGGARKKSSAGKPAARKTTKKR
jgi:hypothetical protein